jgi:hypothetical protein
MNPAVKLTLSASAMGHFERSPEHFIQYRLTPYDPSDAQEVGTAFHVLLLQPEKFAEKVAVLNLEERPDKEMTMASKANRAWKQQFEAINAKKAIISVPDYENVQRMVEKVRTLPHVMELLGYTRAKYEVPYKWFRKGVELNGILDVDSDEFVLDVKKTRDAEPRKFSRSIFDYGYDLQGACYQDAKAGGKLRFGNYLPYYILAVEDTPPYGVSLHRLSKDVLDSAFENYLKLIDLFALCVQNQQWPGYEYKAPLNSDGVFTVDLPFWKR